MIVLLIFFWYNTKRDNGDKMKQEKERKKKTISTNKKKGKLIDEKYRNMLPSLSSDGRKNPKYLEELFYNREIYINDAKITPEYIRYIRPKNS